METISSPEGANPPSSGFSFRNVPPRFWIIAGAILIVLIGGILWLFGKDGFLLRKQYLTAYALVNDKVSASAPIQVNLPKGFQREGAEGKISFEPAIKGEWISSPVSDAVFWKPEKKLQIGNYYTATLLTETGEIKKDFQADEDPAIVDIFPKAKSEAPEYSAITIVFNRPMVPLTSLSELEKNKAPVSLSPETEGRWKWISTRTLQFIPEKTLVRSANYKVEIGGDLISMDGLPVSGRTHNFFTRPLRFEGVTNGVTRYNAPIEFRFNQPVDLRKTAGEIVLKDLATGASILFDASYGSRLIYDSESGENISVEDRGVIRVIPKKDKFGRKNLWDFEASYSAVLSRAYPEKGDIIFSEKAESRISITPIIQSVAVESERTDLASQSLFDPQGKVTVFFYEDIDLNRTSIGAKGLEKAEYGKKCKEDSAKGNYYYNVPCENIDDRTKIVLSFGENELKSPGESVPITFKKITNMEGLVLDTKQVTVPLAVYPPLKIKKITPDSGSKNGSITKLVICANSPLKSLSEEDFSKAVKSDGYMVFGRWDNPYLQSAGWYGQKPPCETGDYVNTVNYGLLPEKPYKLNLSLVDVFGQSAEKEISFVTEKAPNFYMRFHALDKIYNVTAPGKTKLTYAVENFDYVNVHICKTSPLAMVRYLRDNPDGTVPGQSLECLSSATDIIEIPPKLWVNNYFQINIADYFADSRGQYVLSFGNPKYRNTGWNGQALSPRYERTYLSVTNLAVAEKKVHWTKYDELPEITKEEVDKTSSQGELYWVSRIGSLIPEIGALVKVINDPGYAGAIPETAGEKKTDASGVAIFPLVKDVVGAVVESGSDTAIVSSWTDNLNYSGGAYSGGRVYLYTDRPIYRPGQEVYIKGLYRLSFDGEYRIDRDGPVEIKVTDSKGNTIYNRNATVSKYGTFNASLKLPEGAPLGGYYISAKNHYSYFSVEEYVGAAFEAKAETKKDEYIAGETADIAISGKYYFGMPVSEGTVEYSFTAQNYYFDRYTDEYFNFGAGWYSCYDCGYGDSFIKRGQTTLGEDGTAKISQMLDFSSLFKENDRDKSKIITFHATVKDRQGKSVSAQKSFIVHRGDFYLGIKADPSFAGVNMPFSLRVKTVDVKGKLEGKSRIEITISKVEWKSFKRQEVDGNYYNRSERVLTPVITKKVGTNGKGDYREDFKLESPGEYEISAVAYDERNNEVRGEGYVYIYGEGSVSVRPTNNATLDITAEKSELNVGETGRIVFQSPYKNSKALITLERGRIFDYKIVDVRQNVFEYEFPVESRFAPNVYASVLLLSSDPEVKFGETHFQIGRKEKELVISVASDKASYLPGEKVNLKITTSLSSGKRVPAEVSVAVADLSVLALKGNPKKDPLVFFYGGFPLAVTTATNIKNILAEAEIPAGTKGGGGGNPEDLAKKQRGEFKDTAFWKADAETDANGEALLSFTLPDNLGRWQIESLGITEDTKTGVNYKEITSEKKIMVVPLRPRFVVPGDELEIGAQVFNKTDRDQSLAISYDSQTLGLSGGSKKHNKTIRAGESSVAYWKVKAPESMSEGSHVIVLSAKGSEFEDTVKNEIRINSNITYEAVATAGSGEGKTAKEYVFIPEGVLLDRGGLTVKTSATLAVFLSDALKYLAEFPYGCSEQLASKLSGIAIVKKGLSIKNVGDKFDVPSIEFGGNTYTIDDAVTIGLRKIYDTQTLEGGFSYYKGLPADLYLSMRMINSLKDLEEAGYEVDSRVLKSASSYVGNTLLQKGIRHYGIDAFIAGAYAVSRAGTLPETSSALSNAILSSAGSSYVSEKAGTMTLGYLALLASREYWSPSFLQSVYDSLINRASIDSRGTYIKPSSNISWQYYETPIKDTALFLKAISAGKKDYVETPKILRWLLASRDKEGAWGSTDNTLSVIDAFTEYLSWKKETESDFSLALSLDGTKLETYDFSKKTILSMFEKFIPMSSFSANAMHTLSFEKENRNSLANVFYYDMGLKYYLPVDQIPPRDEGISIERNLYGLLDTKEEHPLSEAKVGDVLKGKISIITGKPRHLFAVEDFIPAGFEIINFDLATEDNSIVSKKVSSGDVAENAESLVKDYDLYGGSSLFKNELYPDFKELHDDRLFLFKQELPAGEYSYEYYLRATTPGTFRYLPAVASEMYFPENFGRTGGSLFEVRR